MEFNFATEVNGIVIEFAGNDYDLVNLETIINKFKELIEKDSKEK